MREFWKTLIHGLESGQPACLVSLLSSAGSTPRGAGAMMAVLPGGIADGTIGGGNVEFEAQKLAAEFPENKTRPIEAQGMMIGGVGRLVMPGDKDYNRGSLNPKMR